MDIPIVQPPRLKAGDTIAIVAPASPIEERAGLEQGITALEDMGFRVRFTDRIFQSTRYLAGEDSARAEEFMQAFEDPSIQAIIALRGGYGCSRLIPLLKKRRLRPNPKIFMGFSDLTTIHLFLRKYLGWITLHGPMATSPAMGTMSPEQKAHLISLWTDPSYRPNLNFPELECWHSGTATGEITGGCLSIIAAGIGTPYEIETAGKILFLEDQGEPPYRLDRMLTHLRLAKKLQSLSGLLLGTFKDCNPTQGNYSPADILKDILIDLKIPIIANFPAGHSADNWAIPLGARVRLDTESLSIQILDPAVA
jgi:muramoyltetrapeptide carboxypeptidase